MSLWDTFIPKILDCPYVQIIELVKHEQEESILMFHQYLILSENLNGSLFDLLSYFQYIHHSRFLDHEELFVLGIMMNLLLLHHTMFSEMLLIVDIFLIQDSFVYEGIRVKIIQFHLLL